MENNITVITTKRLLAVLLLMLVLMFVMPAAAQDSMIPDDFDWSLYFQDYTDDWDSWGSIPQYGNSYDNQNTFTYEFGGQTYTMNLYDPTPVPYYDYGTYGNQTQGYAGTDNNYLQGAGSADTLVQQYLSDADGWFYQIEEGYYDDFDSWTGTQTLPESAFVEGFYGYAQTYNLDCEARSAVDLANWFGVSINHGEFLYNLPKSDDPNEGFVGSWTDARGHIPPASYGVYQEPVAALLRNYGLNAQGAYAYTEEALKAQIADGKPVMVWVIGNVELGYAVPYTAASTGRTTYVAPYQHTVVVTGYDAKFVYIQDGALRYTRDWNTFLLSWGALGNRAIFVS